MSNSRLKKGKLAGVIGIISNIVLAGVKLLIGIISGSVSIIADALNNFSDSFSSVITLAGFKASQRPADADHPFGHARYEYIAGLMVSMLVVLVGFELGKSSIEKVINPTHIAFDLFVAIVLSLSILVKLGLAIFNSTLSKQIGSDALKATAIDCRNDCVITAVVLITSIIEHYTGYFIDGIVGILIAVFILYSGIKLTLETISPLIGKKNDENIKNIILEKIKEYPIVIGYHDLMIHDYGPGISFCSIHFEIDYTLDPLYVHELIDKFEREFLDIGVNLTVHYDPVVTDSPELNVIRETIIKQLVNFDERLSMHDLRTIPCSGFTKVFFDVPLPFDLAKQKDNIKEDIEKALNYISDISYQAEITFDSAEFN